MKQAKKLVIYIMICVMFISVASASGFTQNGDAIEEATKSVLKLYVYDEVNAPAEDYIATGSGFIAFTSSILITNYHVIDEAKEIWAVDDQDNVYELKYVLTADKDADIAILEFRFPTGLQPLELYPDDQLKRGSSIIAIGSPKKTKNTVSRGIISNVYYYDIPEIQIDAAISPGSSGGALFNDDGKVIGVTSSTYKIKDEFGEDTAAQNINFAINIAVAKAMYNAWDGTKYSFSNHKSTAKMDFTNVYKHDNVATTPDGTTAENTNNVLSTESWTCANCGALNTDRFCQNCGTEKPIWTCVCGKTNNGKFCGSCGRNVENLVIEFNQALEHVGKNEYEAAITALQALGQYNSGSYETIKGTHVEAKTCIAEAYYQQGMYLVSVHGDHNTILDCFGKAGEYGDASEQIIAENSRYYGAFYDNGIAKVEEGEFEAAIAEFEKAGDYSDAKTQIASTYYLYGQKLLEGKEFEKSRTAFESAGEYADSKEMILKTYYEEGMAAYSDGKFQDAIASFTSAGEYPEAANSILMSYYTLGKTALDNGQKEDAIRYLGLAGEYEDAADLIIQIQESENSKAYEEAMALFEAGEFMAAKDKFDQLHGYSDASRYAKLCAVKNLDGIYEEKKNSKSVTTFTSMVKILKPYMELEEAKELYKKIEYQIGTLNGENNILSAISAFEEAGDYSDASILLEEMKVKYLNRLLKSKNYKGASEFLKTKLIPYGYDQECVLMQPGDSGEIPEYILKLIRIMELSKSIPKNESTYKDGYISAIQKFEEHFGMTADGNITLDEYLLVDGAIYKGYTGSNVQNLIEKLYDLAYLRNLSKDHTAYTEGYYSGIKNAEKDYKLTIDGVITQAEYEVILNKKVEIEKPGNLKMQVTNDTITLTWSTVKGAIKYIIYDGSKKLGETQQCRWVEKSVKTGVSKTYKVEAVKYTTKSSASVSKYIDPYYKPISAKEINSNKQLLKGSYVSIKSLTVDSWAVKVGNNYLNTASAKQKAQMESGHDVYILGRSGSNYVEIILENYKEWDWDNTTEDLLGKLNKISYFSVKGQVNTSFASWGNMSGIPSVTINSITWNYK